MWKQTDRSANGHGPVRRCCRAWIVDNISKESWEEWMEMSIKVINELRLDLGDPLGQRTYDEHLRDFLGVPENLFTTLQDSIDENG